VYKIKLKYFPETRRGKSRLTQIIALLIIGVLAAIAVPRFREASAPPKEARVLAVFGGDVRDSVGGVAVSCASCGDGSSFPPLSVTQKK